MRHSLLALALLAATSSFALSVAAQSYPSKPIRIIVPVAPGGGNDIVARMLAQKLTEAWGQQVVVDNRPGAATTIGAEITARSNADGYTIMFFSVSFAINAAVNPKLPFDPIKDFTPITLVARVPQMLDVNPALPAKSVKEFVALAKAKPGQINYASAGNGSSTHLAMEIFTSMAGISLNHIPYKGTAPGMTDLLAGHVQAMWDAIPPSLPHIKSGRIRPLAVSNPQRFPVIADVPTMAEQGWPQYTFASWFGMVAPARTPSVIIGKLNHEIVRIIQLPEFREKLLGMGVEAAGTSAQDFGRHLAKEIAEATDVVRKRNIRAD